MISVGVRELKNSLSRYLSFAKKGEMVLITERGSPIARLTGQMSHSGAHLLERLGPLAASGLVRLPTRNLKKPSRKKEAPLPGKPLSEMVLEDRR